MCDCVPLFTQCTDIVECMACSDNVVRAGLTVKFRDKETLCQMLSYEMRSPEENMFKPCRHPSVPHAMVYDPPTPEFAVAKITIAAGTKELVIPSVPGEVFPHSLVATSLLYNSLFQSNFSFISLKIMSGRFYYTV